MTPFARAHDDIFNPGDSSTAIPPPSFKWKSRVLLPLSILLATSTLLAYSARAVLIPETEVMVVPVVATASFAGSQESSTPIENTSGNKHNSTVLAQAAGWIEPSPYAQLVPALADGVVQDVLVLEGQNVVAGQVVARLFDTDARLQVASADAKLAVLQAAVAKSEAEVRAAEARLAELNDQVTRTRKLSESGSVPSGQLAQLQFQVSGAQESLTAAKATVSLDKANVRVQEVACDEAKLVLSRMEITSPISGIVMARFVEPGSRVSMSSRGATSGSELMSGAMFKLYDPSKLQVRVDVPLADSGKVDVGCTAEIETEACPGRVFQGVVSRIVHEANIQRNTVQVKVTIKNPDGVLKPEMLARVRFFAGSTIQEQGEKQSNSSPVSPGAMANNPSTRTSAGLLIPEKAIHQRDGDSAQVFVVEHDESGTASLAIERKISTRLTSTAGLLQATEGLRLGDRVIIDAPATIANGTRVRIAGEAFSE